ncbi:MAG: FUSC family protein [Woeseiaceae bacterium]|jgi:uncharacterized membrane protein YgaE (UPF0421/DUF939 family)|nr:FUSC family protein [Woeseiaceae bacterium]
MFDTRVQEAIKIGLAVTIGYGLAFYLGFEKPYWTPLTMLVISLDTTGQTINKGLNRLVGNVIGAPIAISILAVAAQDRWLAMALLSFVVLVCTFLYTGRRFGYTALSAQTVCMLIVLEGYSFEPDGIFTLAATRLQETSLGVIVFTLVSVFLWRRDSEPELRSAVQAVPGAQRVLLDLAWSSEAQDADIRAEQLRLSSLATAARAHFDAAATETRSVRDRRAAWAELIEAQRATQQALGRWIALRPDSDQARPATLVPELEDVRRHIGELLLAAEAQLAGAGDRLGSTKPDIPAAALQRSPQHALQAADAVVFAEALADVATASRRQLDAAARLAGRDLHAPASSQAIAPLATLSDPERWLPALAAVISLWVGALLWIYVHPPGGPVLALMTPAIVIPLVRLPQAPVAIIATPVMLGFAASFLIYVFIFPRLESFFDLAIVIFLYFAGTRFLFYRPQDVFSRLGTQMIFIVASGLSNSMTYSVENFLVNLSMVALVLLLAQLLMNFPFQRQPEKLFLRMAQRFFGTGARLLDDPSRGREDVAIARLLPIAPKLQGVAHAIDFRALPEVPAASVERLVASFDLISNRLREVVRSRGRPVTVDAAERLAAGLQPWRESIADVLRQWSSDPTRPLPGLRTRLDAENEALERRVAAFLAEADGQALDLTTRVHMLGLIGAYRGLAQALVGHAELLERSDLRRWQEARF